MKVAIVGCGIVGAAIAYELSQIPGLTVTVCDRGSPARESTGAALGVLMGAISQKPKGHNLQMRLLGIQKYNEWIPVLESVTGRPIPFNRAGILRLCFAGEELEPWRSLAKIRLSQGWQLQVNDRAFLAAQYPDLNLERVIGAVYSPDDRQVDPTALTLALVDAAQQNGVEFQFGTTVTGIESDRSQSPLLHTDQGSLTVDRLVIAAGLGSTPLTAKLQPVDIRPVLGQAVQVKLDRSLKSTFQPVITGEDVHLVPLGNDEYWIGATVEFPNSERMPNLVSLQPQAEMLQTVMQQATALCPALEHATILRQWFGLRPRPEGRPAPIVEPLANHPNVILATGHYRNGVLLAPATAAKVREAIAP